MWLIPWHHSFYFLVILLQHSFRSIYWRYAFIVFRCQYWLQRTRKFGFKFFNQRVVWPRFLYRKTSDINYPACPECCCPCVWVCEYFMSVQYHFATLYSRVKKVHSRTVCGQESTYRDLSKVSMAEEGTWKSTNCYNCLGLRFLFLLLNFSRISFETMASYFAFRETPWFACEKCFIL